MCGSDEWFRTEVNAAGGHLKALFLITFVCDGVGHLVEEGQRTQESTWPVCEAGGGCSAALVARGGGGGGRRATMLPHPLLILVENTDTGS